MKYHICANVADFGIIEAATEQEARDKAAQMAGYKSESDMAQQLEAPSEFTVSPADE